jgi:two-component system alkaline phosphatase synthesis response regulator PhoP/two-component system response regulator VicR
VVDEQPGSGLTALVVDDEESVRNLVRTTLELDGWEVRTASDGNEALEAAESYRPDAVVLDVMMPGKDGFEVLSELRQTAHGRESAIVMLTAKALPADIYRGSKLGADLYLTKPFDPVQLAERLVFTVLRRNPTARRKPPDRGAAKRRRASAG